MIVFCLKKESDNWLAIFEEDVFLKLFFEIFFFFIILLIFVLKVLKLNNRSKFKKIRNIYFNANDEESSLIPTPVTSIEETDPTPAEKVVPSPKKKPSTVEEEKKLTDAEELEKIMDDNSKMGDNLIITRDD